MQKSMVYLVVVAAILASGIFLSFYGAQITTQDLTVEEGFLGPGESLEIITELDPAKSEMGVFVIQQISSKEKHSVTAKLIDPLGYQIFSGPIDRESFEERFEISTIGPYHLQIENSDQEDLQVMGVIGHMPDKSSLSIGITGFYIVIIGLIGIVGVGIYAIKNRRREKFS